MVSSAVAAWVSAVGGHVFVRRSYPTVPETKTQRPSTTAREYPASSSQGDLLDTNLRGLMQDISSRDLGLGFDLDFVASDEPGNLHERVGGSYRAEIPTVNARHAFGTRGVAHVDPGADHVVELAAERLDSGADLVEDVHGLSFRITRTDHGALAVRRGRTADENARAGAHRARIAGDRFPASAGIDDPAFGMGGTRSRLEDTRESRKVMTQITGSGQERRFSIFVTAITGNLAHRRFRLEQPLPVLVILSKTATRTM